GATPKAIEDGIPDDAYKPIAGDTKEAATWMKKLNQAARAGQDSFDFSRAEPWDRLGNLPAALAQLETLADDTSEAVAEKEKIYRKIVEGSGYDNARLLHDAWCAAFVCPKNSTDTGTALTTEHLRAIERNPYSIAPRLKETVGQLAGQYRFFHWHLEFPSVFGLEGNGGFDCVLGNPPWDKIQPEEEKFFSTVRPDIANASSAKLRKSLIEALPKNDPITHRLWETHKRAIDGVCHFLRFSGILRFSVEGNLNSYRVFTELAAKLISLNGKAGLVVQTGLATDESGKELFDYLLSTGRLDRFLDFENRGVFFQDVHQQFRFCLVTLRGNASERAYAEFGWLLHSLEELAQPARLINLSASDLLLFNPSSRTCPVFASEQDLRISKIIYEHGQHVFLDTEHRFGQIDFLGELFNMTRDSGHFRRDLPENSLPLYEAKFIHQFDHRFASSSNGDVSDISVSEKTSPFCFVKPKNFVDAAVVLERTSKRGLINRWMSGFRDIASPTNERTAIYAVFPFSAVGNSINMVLGLSAEETVNLMANANSFAFDFCARQKISGSHVNIWIFKQLPAIPFATYTKVCPWCSDGQTLRDWIFPRVLELIYTAWDLEPFAIDCGFDGAPFCWD
ncbi:MAG: hypothetical protein KC777_28580, partial [Cyanobacteria bacterium HKST-UBA02]|nr:hypothetical protein [Cyanobacteria bacterium HKST-UBA02]